MEKGVVQALHFQIESDVGRRDPAQGRRPVHGPVQFHRLRGQRLEPGEQLVPQRLEQIVPGGEVEIEGSLGRPGLSDDILDPDAIGAPPDLINVAGQNWGLTAISPTALAALKRFALVARAIKVSPLSTVATAAVREAADGAEFQAEVERETGLRLHVIDGEEEARLSAQGVLLGWPEAEGVICDIGGSSMELAEVGGGKVGKRLSTPLGPFRLQGIAGGSKGMRRYLRQALTEAAGSIARDSVSSTPISSLTRIRSHIARFSVWSGCDG